MRLPAVRSIVLVAAGGAVGAIARVAVGVTLAPVDGGWPWATTLVNLSGAFLLGLLLVAVAVWLTGGTWIRPLLGTGVLGGYTTFSTLALETQQLAARGAVARAIAYPVVTALGGLAAVWLGAALAGILRRSQWGGR